MFASRSESAGGTPRRRDPRHSTTGGDPRHMRPGETFRTMKESGHRKVSVMSVVAGLLATALAAGALLLGGVPAAMAAGETLAVTLSQVTGTGPFDADDAAGHDSSATNDIVRTNDSVTYTVGVRYEGGDQTNPTITFTLPQGEELVSLPPYCLAGSSVTPATLPAPVIPVTATSWTSLPSQTVVCKVAGQTQGTSLDYRFVSTVRPEVPNGAVLTPVIASVTSDQVSTAAESAPVTHTVSAAPVFDLSKRLSSTSDDTGPYFSYLTICSFDATRACKYAEYPLTLSAPAGGKGIASLASPITFTDDLSPDVFYPAGTTSSAAWLAAGASALDKYGARLTVCNSGILNLHGYLPQPSGGSDTVTNAVRNSGTITCTQPGGPGTPVQFTITGADTTAFTVPSLNNDGGALPADLALVISTTVLVEIPLDAINDLGIAANSTVSLATHNAYTNVIATDVTGQPNQDNTVNNVRNAVERIDLIDGEVAKAFVGITGQAGNTPLPGFAATAWEGPPGAGTIRDGNTVVVEGQTVISALTSTRHGLPPLTGTTYSNTTVMCDVWDDTKLGLPQTFDYAGATTTSLLAPSNGSPVWLASTTDGGTTQTDPATVQNLQVQYSYTPTPGAGTDSSCAEGQWFSSPDQVPGATLVDGVWTGVNQVRVSFTDHASTGSDFYQINIAIAMKVISTDTIGTILPNWASRMVSTGVKTLDQVIAAPDRRDSNSTYNPADATGFLGDRLVLGKASARIGKFVKNPGTGAFTDTAVPQYTAGSTVDYRLNPSLTADVAAGTFGTVVVEDCLPRYQAFLSSTRESGAGIIPAIVQLGSPAGAELSCPADQTYIRWDLGANEIGKTIDPIMYTVEILATVRNGNYLNTTLVSSDSDGSAASLRTDTAQIQVVVPTGIKIAKSVNNPIIEVNPTDVTSPRDFTWTIDFANIDAPQNVSDVDIIDVLPATGVNGSVFTGTLALNTVSPAAGTTGLTIQYTKASALSLNVDPSDASNAAAGSTVWCTADSGGTVASGNGTAADCPASITEVTGLRFLRPGEFTTSENLTVDITMTPANNHAGDVYENRTAGRVVGVSQPVGPAVRTVQVVSSSIGDYVWVDLNSNGLQDEGELPLAGFPINLTGTDVDGNTVTRSATTDAAGKYLFDNLASGTYTVTFDPSGLKPGQSFTVRNAGDTAADSNGDPATGSTGPITLGIDTEDLSIDQGVIAPPATLVVSKTVTGNGSPGPYTFTVSCTLNGQPYLLSAEDATFTLSHGENRTITVISGVDCTVAEQDAPAGATVTVTDSDSTSSGGATDGTVNAVTGTATVDITNTFPSLTPGVKIAKLVSASADGPWSEKVTISSGATVYWQLSVTNTGTVALTDLQIDDPSLGAVEPIASLAPGETVTRVIAQHNVSSSYTNTATVSGKDLDGKTSSSTDTADVVIEGGLLAYTGAAGMGIALLGGLLLLGGGGAALAVTRRRKAA